MLNAIKFGKAIENLKPSTAFSYHEEVPTTEVLFDKVEWITGVAENGTAITTTVNPHSELTWDKVNAEMTRLQTEHDSLVYSRARELAYPITKEFIEAYTEKEIGGDSTKWDAYVIKYNKVRSDNPKS